MMPYVLWGLGSYHQNCNIEMWDYLIRLVGNESENWWNCTNNNQCGRLEKSFNSYQNEFDDEFDCRFGFKMKFDNLIAW